MSDNHILKTGSEAQEWSVSRLSAAIKSTIETKFRKIRLSGELSGLKRHSSGHCYFSLKDDQAVLQGVMWRNNAARLSAALQDGMQVIATGQVTTYAGRSQYQIIVDTMHVAGTGALMTMLEERRRKLQEAGLFNLEHKRPIPFLPRCIGVITSPTGAVIRDILHRIHERFPVPVLLWPVAVQGEDAPRQIMNAIRGFAQETPIFKRPDVLIIARGGGSIEDLWAFQDEDLVIAVNQSPIPIITAIGHETDTSLVDFASDRRAPTPTAAAEMAVPVRQELQQAHDLRSHRLNRVNWQYWQNKQQHLKLIEQRLPKLQHLYAPMQQRLDMTAMRLPHAREKHLQTATNRLTYTASRLQKRYLQQNIYNQQNYLQQWTQRLQKIQEKFAAWQEKLTFLEHRLQCVSVEEVLKRGFTIIHQKGKIITHGDALSMQDNIRIQFQDKSIDIPASKDADIV